VSRDAGSEARKEATPEKRIHKLNIKQVYCSSKYKN
jgi:hypothetical protein